MSTYGKHTYQKTLDGTTLNMQARSINSAATSNVIDASGFNQITLEIAETKSAATNITVYFETSPDNSSWHQLQSVSWSSGTGTLTDATYSRTAATDKFVINQPINNKYVRFTVTGTGAPDANDKVIISATLGNI